MCAAENPCQRKIPAGESKPCLDKGWAPGSPFLRQQRLNPSLPGLHLFPGQRGGKETRLSPSIVPVPSRPVPSTTPRGRRPFPCGPAASPAPAAPLAAAGRGGGGGCHWPARVLPGSSGGRKEKFFGVVFFFPPSFLFLFFFFPFEKKKKEKKKSGARGSRGGRRSGHGGAAEAARALKPPRRPGCQRPAPPRPRPRPRRPRSPRHDGESGLGVGTWRAMIAGTPPAEPGAQPGLGAGGGPQLSAAASGGLCAPGLWSRRSPGDSGPGTPGCAVLPWLPSSTPPGSPQSSPWPLRPRWAPPSPDRSERGAG